MKKALILSLVAIILFGAGYAAYLYLSDKPEGEAGSGDIATTEEAATIQQYDVRLLELGGATKRISEYSEGILFLNFWATWCGYCELEMPDLIELDGQMRAEGIGRVVAVDVNEKESVVEEYLGNMGFTGLTVLLDTDGAAAKKFDIEGYPTTFVFKDGRLLDFKVGMMTREEMDAMLEMARQ